MSADQQPDRVGRPAQPPVQICPFWRGPGGHAGDQVAEQSGGYSRGRAKSQVAIRDRLTVSLPPQLAEFAAAE